MKKVFVVLFFALVSISMSAQLAWNTEMKKADFENGLTLLSKTDNVKWLLTGGVTLGKTIISIPIVNPDPDPYNDNFVVALPREGLADSLSFTVTSVSGVTFTVSISSDNTHWTSVWTNTSSDLLGRETAKIAMANNTRYVKFAATGKASINVSKIMAEDKSALAVNTDERMFASALVGEPAETKNITVTWTSIVANVTSTDPHFTVSQSTIGQKAQAGNENAAINQSTTITISYNHTSAGHHTGDIVIAGEGKEVRVAVSGTTEKAHPQVAPVVADLVYGEHLGDAVITDELALVPGHFSWVDMPEDTILDAGNYTLNVLFTPADTSSYFTKTQPVSFRVNKAHQSITWLGQDTALIVDEPVSLTAELSSGLPVTYAFTSCAVFISADQTQIMGTEEGEVMVVAFHQGNNNYYPTTVEIKSFTIAPAPMNPTGVADVLTPQEVREAQKFYHDGQVIIYHRGSTYDLEGRRIK